jgi:hypothetical protein
MKTAIVMALAAVMTGCGGTDETNGIDHEAQCEAQCAGLGVQLGVGASVFRSGYCLELCGGPDVCRCVPVVSLADADVCTYSASVECPR